jgi:uncharacterized protein
MSQGGRAGLARRAAQETRAIYRLADQAYGPFGCPSSAQCCQLAQTGRQPWLWPSEWHVLLEHLAARGRALPPPRADGGCPLLDEGGQRCTVYPDRPLGCRTFFCQRRTGPAREPVEQTDGFIRRLARLGANLEDAEPRPLLDWLAQAR